MQEEGPALLRFSDRQAAVGQREGPRKIALRQQQAAKIAIDLDQLRLEGKRAPIMRRRFIASAEGSERNAEIAVTFGVLRPCRHHAPVMRHGFLKSPFAQQHVAQPIMSLDQSGIDGERTLETGPRLAVPALLREHIPEARMGLGIVAAQRDCLAQMGAGIIETPACTQRLREVEVTFR